MNRLRRLMKFHCRQKACETDEEAIYLSIAYNLKRKKL